jgi:hypothetical protein
MNHRFDVAAGDEMKMVHATKPRGPTPSRRRFNLSSWRVRARARAFDG